MLSSKNNGGVARRGFLGAAVAGAMSGLADGQQTRPSASSYRESIDTPVVARHQVVVAGGGASGVIAAAAAARSGADTLLIERYAFLGGNGTAGLMTCYNGFRNQHAPDALQTVKGIPAEYIAELVRLGGVAEADHYRSTPHDYKHGDLSYTIPFDAEVAKVAALNLLKKEGVKLRLHSWVAAPMMSGSRVTGVVVESKSGRQAIAADIVIDCTGDGDIAARAKAEFMRPSPTRDERMVSTLMYGVGGVPAGIQGPFNGIRIGDRVVRWGPELDGDGLDVEFLTRAEVEARLKLWDDVEKLRKTPGLESVYLAKTATNIGVRETRRIVGLHVLTTEEAIEGKRFPDVIAISSNPIPEYKGKRYFFAHEGFDIPYRCLVPKTVNGLVLSGRSISCEQPPFQSARSMAPAMAVGHASGCAAALAATKGLEPRNLDFHDLQKLLLSQKAELRMPG